MTSALLTICTDIGRIDATCLPHQSLMELFIQDFDDVDIAKDEEGNFFPIELWWGLKFDSHFYLISIDFDFQDCETEIHAFSGNGERRTILTGSFAKDGSVNFRFVPPTATTLNVTGLELEGELCTADLPDGLENLSVHKNCLKSTFSTADLAQTLVSMRISENHFFGSFALESLPKAIITVNARENNFSGELKLSTLRHGIKQLDLSKNEFSGVLSLCGVPESLTYLAVRANSFDHSDIYIDRKCQVDLIILDHIFSNHVFFPDGSKYDGNEITFVSYG